MAAHPTSAGDRLAKLDTHLPNPSSGDAEF